MPLKSSETADSRVIGRGEWSPASRRRKYVVPSVWRVNPSGMLKKLRNTGSKQTFDSIYRYRHRETRLSTLRLKAALIASCEASCILYICTSLLLKCVASVVTMVTTGMKLEFASFIIGCYQINVFIAHEFVMSNHKTHKS